MSDTISILSMVEISEVQSMSDDNRKGLFTDEESEELRSKHIQTTAGYYAIKNALIELCKIKGGLACHKDFTLCHLSDGKPVLKNGNALINPEKVQISISHTKTHAYGIIAIRKDCL